MASDNGKRRGFSRRRFIQGAAAAAAASGSILSSAAREEEDAEEKHGRRRRPPNDAPDTVLINGKIHTMDDEGTVVSAVSITDGRFAEVGHSSRSHHGPNTKVIDLRGRTVVPGIIDNHDHIVLMGNRPGFHTPLENAYSIPDVQAIYAARSAGLQNRDAWITTIGGFHFNHIYGNPSDPLSGRFPTLQELDAAVPNNPAFMMISFSGPGATNSAGKAILERQGVVVASNGAIAGGFGVTECSKALLYLRQTLLNATERRRSVRDAMSYAHTVGVTTHIDQGAFQATNTAADGAAHEDNYTMHIPFLQVYGQDQGSIRLRINFLHMESDPNTPELVQRLKNAFPFFGNDMVRSGGIGEFIAQGTNDASPFKAAAKRVAQAGWRAEVHSLGRRNTPASPKADFEFEIEGFEAANSEFPGIVRERRWVIAHVPGITQEWIDRLQAIGGNLSLTGWQYLAGNPTASTVAPYAGPPFRMIVDSGKRPGGIHAGLSSDGMQIAPMNPWLHMYYATTGINARKVLINPNQQISREEALSLYTRENGWFLREEDQLGTIESGKLADLVVLNSDYFTVPNEDLKKIRSVLTVVGGDVVYDGGVLELRG
jgi:predicted amidohydrolase YtcJ